jgi:hypothetical protein
LGAALGPGLRESVAGIVFVVFADTTDVRQFGKLKIQHVVEGRGLFRFKDSLPPGTNWQGKKIWSGHVGPDQ